MAKVLFGKNISAGKYQLLLSSLKSFPDLLSDQQDQALWLVTDNAYDVQSYHDDNAIELIIMACEGDDSEHIQLAKNFPKLQHLLGANAPYEEDELVKMWAELTCQNQWGPQSIVEDCLFERRLYFCDSSSIAQSIDQLLNEQDFGAHLIGQIDYFKTTANELITNAFYHSPFGPKDRKNKINLKDDQSIVFEVAINQKRLAVSVTDSYGLLSWDKMVKAIARAQEERRFVDEGEGAGLGLRMVFDNSNQIIVRHCPNRRSEVISVIEHYKRQLDFKQRIKSFHYYMRDHL